MVSSISVGKDSNRIVMNRRGFYCMFPYNKSLAFCKNLNRGILIMSQGFNHFDENGNAVMVDVSGKNVTYRTAVATGEIHVGEAIMEAVKEGSVKKGDVLVVGCSSSEMVGGHIGKDSSLEAARALYAGAAPVLAEKGIWLAAQCCEHLNRAIILEREAAEKYGWEEVCVVPRPHAGGSWAPTCWKNFKAPVAVEELRANAAIDIGGTLIGMHLRRVAVPVRLSLHKIGEANILCAYTRPKLIGGERARYTEED